MRIARIITPWIGSGIPNTDSYRPDIVVTSWTDVTNQESRTQRNSLIEKPRYTIDAICTDAQLATIKASNKWVVLWDIDADNIIDPPLLDTTGKNNLKTKLNNVYNPDVTELVTASTNNPVVIDLNLRTDVQLRPVWKSGIQVTVGQIFVYSDNLYKVIQSHTTQATWTPDVAKSLWTRFYESSVWPWTQPTGAHDAYPLGAKVLWKTYTWESKVNANVWEPGSVGAESLWLNLTPPPPSSVWSYPVAYKVNDIVTYNGNTYKCLQAHTSQVGWSPPVVPALWQLQ